MRKLIVLILVVVLFSAAAFSAEPGGWNGWLLAGEMATGFGLGALTAIATTYVVIIAALSGDLDSRAGVSAIILGDALGATAGTLFVGEVFGAETENKTKTYLGTLGCSAATAALFFIPVSLMDWDQNNDAANIVGYSSLVAIPITTAIMYNVFKKPIIEDKAALDVGLEFNPKMGLMADTNGDLVPTYGVEFNF